MTGRPAPSRGALPWRQASIFALCIVMLVTTIAIAASGPGRSISAFANQSATPGAAATPSVLGTPSALASPSAKATPSALATPSSERPSDWSNGVEPIWTYETGTDYWAGRFPPDRDSGVFGLYTHDSHYFRVFDAETFEQLWTWDKGTTAYSWRPTESAFLIAQGNQLTARNPRNGTVMWRHWVRDDEWDFTTYDGVGGDAPQRFAYITSDRNFTMLDLTSGAPLLEARRRGDNIDWETRDGILTLRNGNFLSVVDLNAGEVLWSYAGAGSDIRYDPVDDDWFVSSGGTLAVIDPSTGEEMWSFAGPGSDVSWNSDDDALYVKSGGTLAVIDPTTGEQRWAFAGSGDSISWTADEDALYAISGKDVSKLDPIEGTEFWRFSANAELSGIRSFRIVDGMLLVRAGASVSSIDPDLGVELWRFSLPDTEDVSWGVLDDDDTLYVYGDSILSVIDAETGGERWRFTPGETIQRVWMNDDTFTVLTESNLFSIEATTGDERWSYDANTSIESIDMMWSADMERFTLIAADRLIAINTSTGEELWRSESIPGWGSYYFDPDTEAYTLRLDDSNALIDAETGETLLRGSWEEQGSVIYNRAGNLVTAFDLDARGELWRYSSDTTVDRFYLTDTTVLVVTRNLLVALDRTTGTELWTFVAQAPIESFARDDSIIRLTDSYGTLYALAPKAIQLEAGGAAVTTEEVTLRGAPNPVSVERATVEAGTAVTITGAPDTHDGTTWWPVVTGESGDQGWVPAEALEPTANAPSMPSTPAA